MKVQTLLVGLFASTCAAEERPWLDLKNGTLKLGDALSTKPVGACWKETESRGVGRVVHECDHENSDGQALLCYPPCEKEFKGVGPVCWQECPVNTKDIGLFCVNGSKIHVKKSYGRGVGKPMTCDPSEEQDALFFGLCYPKCKKSFNGIGPICWKQCGGNYPIDGGAMCCKTKADCKAEIMDMTVKLPIAILKAVRDSENVAKEMADIKDIIHDALGFVLPVCGKK